VLERRLLAAVWSWCEGMAGRWGLGDFSSLSAHTTLERLVTQVTDRVLFDVSSRGVGMARVK